MVHPVARKGKSRKQEAGIAIVVGDKGDVHREPKTFRLCPLGCQFYSSRRLRAFDLMECRIDVPGRGRTSNRRTCTAAVVRCEREDKNLYRVWLQFVDLPKAESERIRCISKNGKHLCSYCENY